MKLQDIMDMVEGFLKIDETNLSRESLATSEYYAKVLRIRTEESVRLNILKGDLKRLYVTKREYYGGSADPEVYKEKPFNRRLIKAEVEQYIEADSEIQTIITKIDVQQEKLTYLNDALKQISNRNFNIKNSIDYQKLLAGGY